MEHEQIINIHLGEESDQPYVKVYCTGEYHYIQNNYKGFDLLKEVYLADPNIYYSFSNTKINCKNCLSKKTNCSL
jgi:hypothetical protein